MNNRIRLPGTLTSTDPRYISFAFDTISNITLNKDHSRIIINCGLVDQSIESGLNIRVRDDSNLTDEADGKHIVHKLCASKKNNNFEFFFTFTAYMSKHFGLSPITRWLDSGEWINDIPDFHQLLPHG